MVAGIRERHGAALRQSGVIDRFIDDVSSGELGAAYPVVERLTFSVDGQEISKLYLKQEDISKGTLMSLLGIKADEGDYTLLPDSRYTQEDLLLASSHMDELDYLKEHGVLPNLRSGSYRIMPARTTVRRLAALAEIPTQPLS